MAIKQNITEINSQYGKVPPQAIEMEEAVLGALMLEADAIHKVSGILTAESFYKNEHRIIFEAVKSLANAGKQIDLLTVTRSLIETNQLDVVGGPMYITQLTGRVAAAAHIEAHSRVIAQLHAQRELIRIGSETINEAYEEGTDIEDLLNSVKSKISAIEDSTLSSNTGQSHIDVIRETLKEIEIDCLQAKAGKQPGITTGLRTLNNATGGWRNTNLIIVAARPGVGKTSLALHFAKMAARAGNFVNFYGLEMKSSDLMRIMISGESSVNRLLIRDGKIDSNDWSSINRSLTSFEKLPIIWNDCATLTASQIKSNTIRNRKAGKCDLIIIDYLQLIKATDKKAIREQQISEISRTLKEIALSENIPVICLSQLNRAAAGEKPQLHHLRESGAIEQDADIVIFPWRNEADNRFYISIAKNRRGTCGDFEIFANEEMTGFTDAQQDESYNPDNSKPF
ncbi:MAG: replicative DNA helicase [Prolixibacteraceae bacterium]|nr:replicative DNA helicase [Prolixibacteraceae bacterium]